MQHRPAVLILPGLGNSGSDHWQSHWQRNEPGFERVMQEEWDAPACEDWIAGLDAAVAQREEPLVLVAHSSACALVAHWVQKTAPSHVTRVCGALLVAPSDPDNPNYPAGPTGFGPVPMTEFPFPSIMVASSDDPYIDPGRARQYADAWGSRFVLLETAGHINASSGFGPWPEGRALLETLLLQDA